MENVYEARRTRLTGWMEQEGISLLMLEDFEGRRDSSIRWLTGQPGDALLFLSPGKQCILVPWDINQAFLYSQVDVRIPYTEFNRSPLRAIRMAAEYFAIPPGARIEIPPTTSYPRFLQFVDELNRFDVLCREEGAAAELQTLRSVKDEAETAAYRMIGGITNEVIELLIDFVKEGKIGTELEAALCIEIEARRRGCEGTGFETLAAGHQRSFGIHAFPSFTVQPFGGPGFSILDFGLRFEGYTSDVTLTFARGPLSKAQERMLLLVQKAYDYALGQARKEVSCRNIAQGVDEIFRKARKSMPHSLGHGIGLDAHEAPFLRSADGIDWTLQPGMVITLEPGLYDPLCGGCRLENDILITEGEPEVLTTSRIVRL